MYEIDHVFDRGNKPVHLICMKNINNLEVKLLSYGAAIVEILVPDKRGLIENIVLTHDRITDYIQNPSYFGATVGRTSGRIGDGQFFLDGERYRLNKGSEVNQIHGGPQGFSFQVWDYDIESNQNGTVATFHYVSKDMEENYPGELAVKVTYTLTNHDVLIIEYEGKTDKKTLCNLTNHAYFNLSGNYKEKVTKQYLKISANHFLALDKHQIPTGKEINVQNTPMDFNEAKLIGKDIENDYEQLMNTGGYDHVWMLKENKHQVELMDELSGRKMTLTTSYPSVVVYTYNFPKSEGLKYGKTGTRYDGICFETQYPPDGINHGDLDAAILDVGQLYYEKSEFVFSII